jgi:hypothetical protein
METSNQRSARSQGRNVESSRSVCYLKELVKHKHRILITSSLAVLYFKLGDTVVTVKLCGVPVKRWTPGAPTSQLLDSRNLKIILNPSFSVENTLVSRMLPPSSS